VPSATLLTSLVISTVHTSPQWVDAQRSFGDLGSFRIAVELHAKAAERAGISEEAIRQQMESTLRARHIEVALAVPEDPHGLGFLFIDVHVKAVGSGTSVAWTLQASQMVRLHSGATALGSTWAMADLVHGPSEMAADLLRTTLQPALDEFCDDYLASRPLEGPSRLPPSPPRESARDDGACGGAAEL
jgi:hypothetical protein